MDLPLRRPAVPAGTPLGDDVRRPRVVVGIDGSAGSRDVLIEGLLAAARRGGYLDVVTSYTLHLSYAGGAPLDVPDIARLRADAEGRARAVVERSRDADLFVVGTLPDDSHSVRGSECTPASSCGEDDHDRRRSR